MDNYDYQNSLESIDNAWIVNGICERSMRFSKKDKYIGHKIIGDKHHIVNISSKVRDSTVVLTLHFDAAYLNTLPFEFIADVWFMPPCNCCVENDSILVSDLQNIENAREIADLNIDIGDTFDYNYGTVEITKLYKRYTCFVPSIVLFFANEN